MTVDAKVFCPHCLNEFYLNEQPREEILNSSVQITRKKIERSSWQEIDDTIRSGYGYQLFETGDSVSFQMKNGIDYVFDIAATNLWGGNNAVFVARDCLPEDKPMNKTNTNAGGFGKCLVADYLQNEILPLFPDDLASVIKTREITQRINGTTYTSAHKLWLPSQTELFADCPNECDVGDEHFPLFADRPSRVKKRVGGKDSIWYWVRSPFYHTSDFFCFVYSDGCAYGDTARYSYGLAPAFVIGS